MFKIISISNNLPGVQTTAFSSDVSLTDFDIVIIDPAHVVSSFPEARLEADNKLYIKNQFAHILLEQIERRCSELSALLNNGRMIVAFLDPVYNVKLLSNSLAKNPTEVNNYSWLPDEEKRRFVNRLIGGKGTGLKLVDKHHLFTPYFSAFQKDLNFKAYVDIPITSFDLGDAFISNSADLTAGFSFKVSNGIMIFLPKFDFNEVNNKKFVGVLLQIAKKYFGSEVKTPPPDWTSGLVLPHVDNLDAKIREVEMQILELESHKSEIENERDSLNEYKFLLYEQGHTLEGKVLDSLRLLGFKAETIPGENTDFDVILESDEGRAIAEVEGKDDNAIHKEKIDQLISAINQDADGKDSFAKGVLVGNHYRLKPPEQREEPFTKTVVNLAKQYHYALITTADLYNVAVYILQHPEDEECKKACRKAIFAADGNIVEFPIPEK